MNWRGLSIVAAVGAVVAIVAAMAGWAWLNLRSPPPIQLEETELEVRVLLEDLVMPWDMDWSDDGWIWFCEKRGQISRYSPDRDRLERLHLEEGVFQSEDNSGMHGFALHPDFPSTPWVYAHYTYELKHSRLVRFSFDESSRSLVERTVLLDAIPSDKSHNGSRIVFSPGDRALFLALGDAFNRPSAQDATVLSGSILRLNEDGTLPPDNPFGDSPVWSIGHRNPQGLVWAGNGLLYSSEHGDWNDDELNLIVRGGNYGHPDVLGMCDQQSERRACSENNVVEPLFTWSPTAAVAGIEYYDHPAIPEWRNSLLVTTMKPRAPPEGKRLVVLKLNESGNRVVDSSDYLRNQFGRLREVMAAPDGRVYLFTSNRENNPDKRRRFHRGDDLLVEIRNSRYRSP